MDSIRHVPSVRKRWVRRANFLRNHRPFKERLRELRRYWEESYSEFPLGDWGVPPERPRRYPLRWHYPDSLGRAETRQNEISERSAARLILTDEEVAFWHLTDQAFQSWSELVYSLCEEWWPSKYFPTWTHPNLNPASEFVSSCLLWEPKYVSPDSILQLQFELWTGYYDPFDTENHPEAIFWRTRFEELADSVIDASRRKQVLTEDEIKAAMSAAVHIAVDRSRDARFRYESERTFARLYPGITSSALRLMEQHVREHRDMQSYFDDGEFLDRHIRELSDAAMSKNQIANLLGVSRDKVRDTLRH